MFFTTLHTTDFQLSKRANLTPIPEPTTFTHAQTVTISATTATTTRRTKHTKNNVAARTWAGKANATGTHVGATDASERGERDSRRRRPQGGVAPELRHEYTERACLDSADSSDNPSWHPGDNLSQNGQGSVVKVVRVLTVDRGDCCEWCVKVATRMGGRPSPVHSLAHT